jgi:uncharacterized protein YkwD
MSLRASVVGISLLVIGVALARDPLPLPPVTTGLEAAERLILQQTNLERQRAGLKPLTLDARLTAAARLHAREMSQKNYFAHESPTPGLETPSDRIHAAGSIDWSAGENIAFNEESSAKAGATLMRQWLNSPPHRASILKPQYTHIGIGVYRDSKGRNYGVQDFVERNFNVALEVSTRVQTMQTVELRGTVPGNFEVALFALEDFVGALNVTNGAFNTRLPFEPGVQYRLGARPIGSSLAYTIGATLTTPRNFQAGALGVSAQPGSRFNAISATLTQAQANVHTLELRFSNATAPVRVFVTERGQGERSISVVGNQRATITCPVSTERRAVRLAYSQGERYIFTHRFVLDCATGNVIAGATQ